MSDGGKISPSPSSRTVLLVDDDQAVLALFGSRLERAGFQVLKARTAQEAVQVAQAVARIDVLATDLVLTSEFRIARAHASPPAPSGLVLMRQMLARQPDVRVILFSGHSTETLRKLGPLPTGIAFLRKPFGPETLLHHIRQALSVAEGFPPLPAADLRSPRQGQEQPPVPAPRARAGFRWARWALALAFVVGLGIGIVLLLQKGGMMEWPVLTIELPRR